MQPQMTLTEQDQKMTAAFNTLAVCFSQLPPSRALELAAEHAIAGADELMHARTTGAKVDYAAPLLPFLHITQTPKSKRPPIDNAQKISAAGSAYYQIAVVMMRSQEWWYGNRNSYDAGHRKNCAQNALRASAHWFERAKAAAPSAR